MLKKLLIIFLVCFFVSLTFGTSLAYDNFDNSNVFLKGRMHYKMYEKENYRTCAIDFSIDYRSFINNANTSYSKDLAKLAILFASDVYDNLYIELTDGLRGGTDLPTSLGNLLGLKDTYCIKINNNDYLTDQNDITEFLVGHKKIDYKGKNFEIILVSVRGTNATNAEWSSNFDLGADTKEYYEITGYNHPEWIDKSNHKGFEVTSNRVFVKLNKYLNTYIDPKASKIIFITGHSRGGAIANLLGKHFEEDINYKSFTYTFASPNTTIASNAANYKTIFNIVNEDDLIAYLPNAEWGFKKYGQIKSVSVKEKYESHKLKEHEVGTWEWFIGSEFDYNNDSGMLRTLSALGVLADNRDDLYKLDSTSDGKVLENKLGYATYDEAKIKLIELETTLSLEKMLRFCQLSIIEGSNPSGEKRYYIEVNYAPAYLMQMLCNMTTSFDTLGNHALQGKYAWAKTSFIASSGILPFIGGMVHAHMPPTYYLMVSGNAL